MLFREHGLTGAAVLPMLKELRFAETRVAGACFTDAREPLQNQIEIRR